MNIKQNEITIELSGVGIPYGFEKIDQPLKSYSLTTKEKVKRNEKVNGKIRLFHC